MAASAETDRARWLDRQRRAALLLLKTQLTRLAELTQVLTTAAFRSDRDALVAAATDLLELASTAHGDLEALTEIYNGLRTEIIRRLPEPAPEPAETIDPAAPTFPTLRWPGSTR